MHATKSGMVPVRKLYHDDTKNSIKYDFHEMKIQGVLGQSGLFQGYAVDSNFNHSISVI